MTGLAARRAAAESAWQRFGWPATKLESWRHTNLRAFAAVVASGAAGQGGWSAPTSGTSGDGCEVADLVNAAASDHPAVVRWMGAVARIDRPEDALNARNLGTFAQGRLVHVGRGERIEQPIDFTLEATGGSLAQRLLVVCEPNSEATVCLRFDGADNADYTREVVVEVVLLAGARLSLVWLQREGDRGQHLGAVTALQHRDSRLSAWAIQTGAALGRVDTRVHLAEAGASCSLDGLYLGGGSRHLDNHLEVHHEAGHTDSSMLYKGVLDDRSTGVFRGNVLIREGAAKSTTEQLNRNLLLGAGATANTKPQLEIDNDDVRASHGATVGELDDDALFYLRSRGIDAATAQGLLTRGFAGEVIARIPMATVRDELNTLLQPPP